LAKEAEGRRGKDVNGSSLEVGEVKSSPSPQQRKAGSKAEMKRPPVTTAAQDLKESGAFAE
jgi:hypothetical protein